MRSPLLGGIELVLGDTRRALPSTLHGPCSPAFSPWGSKVPTLLLSIAPSSAHLPELKS